VTTQVSEEGVVSGVGHVQTAEELSRPYLRLAGKKFGHPAGMQKINWGLKNAAATGSKQ